jgi:thioredoxin-like negative regulator of GroEL
MNKGYNIISWTLLMVLGSNASCLMGVLMSPRPQPKMRASSKEITSFEEYKSVINGSKPIVIKIYTTTCPNCTAMEGAFNDVALQYGNEALFFNLNANTNDANLRKVAYTYASKGVPTTVFLLPGGSQGGVKPAIGALSKQELQQRVENFLAQRKSSSMMPKKQMSAPMPAKTMPSRPARSSSRKPSTCTSCCR